MRTRPLRVLVVDDDERLRHAVCKLLKAQADIDIDIDVVCEASNGHDAVRFAREHTPNLVLLDIKMPVLNGFEAARLIKHELPKTKILMVSQYDSPAFIREALAAGASGYVLKDKAWSGLIPEVRRIRRTRTE